MKQIKRCPWVGNTSIYQDYHDTEWGKPEYDSIKLFELLCLEGQQAGLNWLTILKRREDYRQAFFNKGIEAIAQLSDADISDILANYNIIKHRKKAESIRSNAQAFLRMQEQGIDLSKFLWYYVNHQPIVNEIATADQVIVVTEVAKQLSKDLKKLGFTFLGPTSVYALMQACGMVNDHFNDCDCKYA